MGNDQKKFSEKEKVSIALKAADGVDKEIKRLAKEHGTTEENIRSWIRENNLESVNISDEVEEISLDATDSFIDSVSYGATKDTLNYSRLAFWTIFGATILTIFIISVLVVHEYTRTASIQYQFEQSEYYDVHETETSNQAMLDSFGVIDPDAGIYRIPIDSAITIIVNE